MAEFVKSLRVPDLKMEVSLFMLKHLLPLPIVRRSYKLRLYLEQTKMKIIERKRLPPELSDVLFIGSQNEGLSVTVTEIDGGDAFCATSDYDTMPVLKQYRAKNISESDSTSNESEEVNILEMCEASHPGYCRLRSKATGKFVGMRFNPDCSGKVDIFHDGVQVGETNVPYADVIVGFSDKPDTVEIKTYIHGPAIACTKIQTHPGNITQTGIETDVVLSIKCQSWPIVALEWFKRQETKSSESDWPSHETKENMKSTECYVVAVPHQLSPNPTEEWRYSFAPVEKVLARSLTYAQKGSYIIAKMLFKTALQNIDKVSSYCLKTQMFWLCEEESSSAWSYDQVGYYALEVLSKLAKNLKNGVVRHYIIPENNIVSHIPASTLQEVSETLSELVCNPFPVMEKIRRTTKYFGIILHPHEESFLPVLKLLEQQTADDNEIKDRFHASKLAIMGHYCSMLKKPIVNKVQEEFSKLKFALLMDIAEEIGNDSDSAETADDMIAKIANELSKYTEENVKRWHVFVQEYWKSVDNIKSENVEQMLTTTSDGIQKVEAF
ncbi:uncharacterized protein LOC123524315 [Mercenaria mercenaria]|uniref:uncharacterized protein LOC123524315 n=1 Tax=Mercenaria mercenaria TaxID=6596 RepID=UPI00234F89EB|nr:uncharacterized protein LOC123524315 [Mercenaria mercenaria]